MSSHGHDHGHAHGAVKEVVEVKKEFSVKSFKILMLFVIFLCSLSGILPKLVPAVARNKNVLSFLNCFSAGIFLGMALIHIIPEGSELYAEWAEDKKIEKPFPLDYVLIFVGYLIVLAVDRVITTWLLKLTGKEDEAHIGHSHGGGHNHDDHDHTHENKITPNKSEKSKKLDHVHEHTEKKSEGEIHSHVNVNPDVLQDYNDD